MAPVTSARKPYRPPRPSKWGYDFRNIADFPHRLLFPPDAGVGTVRSIKITPKYDVSLYDVLDGKHLPPLTLKDFEQYLVFNERSAENLYFIYWLRDYRRDYEAWQDSIKDQPAEKGAQSLPELTLSFAKARATFFNHDSHLELNLPSQEVEDMLNKSKGFAHPPPLVLADVERQVEGMLRESLMKFIQGSCANSGRRRGLFAIAVGMLVIAIGLIPVLLSVYHHTSRGVRFAGLPAFWFGATTAIAGFHGVCVVIFLFGDARQLYPYELQTPLLPPVQTTEPMGLLPLPVTARGSNDGHSNNVTNGVATDSQSEVNDGKIRVSNRYSADDQAMPMSPSTIVYNEKDGIPQEWEVTAGFIPPAAYTPSITSSNTYSDNSNSNRGSSGALHFDFDSLPPPATPRRSSEGTDRSSFNMKFPTRGVFCTMTKVLSPIVSRAQWEIVIRSAIMGVFVAIIFSAIMYVLPYHN
ncbi:hypothetical protein FRB94_006004 [Tulasnella sp. JGI-2019a]|nr:hypothetical protein FRB94_006004 [Tulasnella sp. JGI-2019a]